MSESDTWWLSFADPNRPPGTQFLGVLILEAQSFMGAHATATAAGLNPGGEIQGFRIPPEQAERIPADRRMRLLTRDEAHTVNLIAAGVLQ